MTIFDALVIVGVSSIFFSILMVISSLLDNSEGKKLWKPEVGLLLIGIVCLLISVPKVSKEYQEECKTISKMQSKLLERNSELYPQLAKLDGYKIYYNGGDKPIDIEEKYRKDGDNFLANTIIERIGDPFNKKAIYIVSLRLRNSDDFKDAKKYLKTDIKKQIERNLLVETSNRFGTKGK